MKDFVKKDFFVKIKYQMKLKDEKAPEWFSQIYETSFILGREPLPKIIEENIFDKKAGDIIELVIPPESAYGPHLPHLIREINISSLKHPERLKVGEWYEEVSPYGSRTSFKVLEIKEDKVKADFNHPAAGKEVIMKIEILEARPATAYEILSAEIKACSGG